LLHDDYPRVKFWTRKDWVDSTVNDVATIDKQHRKARSSQGINVMMVYTEDENSKVVDGHVASEIQTYAQSVWVHMANIYGAPRAPMKWGDASVKIAQVYRKHMYSWFPILQFCELNWKVDHISTDSYPSWYSWFVKRPKTDAKTDQEEVVLTIAEDPPPNITGKS
ncbi:hypothetical protein L208DRAFT_1280553, partial [Tricholoma matsutake]